MAPQNEQPAHKGRRRMIRAANYYARESPMNFWSADFSGIDEDFERILKDGFNTAFLCVPWSEFQPMLNPVGYNDCAWERMEWILDKAAAHGLGIIFRVSYGIDCFPAPQYPYRIIHIFELPEVYDAWLLYIEKLYKTVSRYGAFRSAFISWEDFYPFCIWWSPQSRRSLQASQTSGYQNFLADRYSLKDVSAAYGCDFHDWKEVPLPSTKMEPFRFLLEFFDDFFVNRLLKPAQERFPGLSQEIRVDADPVFNRDGTADWFHHDQSYYRADTAEILSAYYGVATGQKNNSDFISAAEGRAAMEHTLKRLYAACGGPVFLGQFIYEHNSSGCEHYTRINPPELGCFIETSAELLEKYTAGYGVWTYRDCAGNVIFNPSFVLGLTAWQGSDGVKVESHGERAWCVIPAGGSLRLQKPPRVPPLMLDPKSVTVAFKCSSLQGQARVALSIGTRVIGEWKVAAGEQLLSSTFDATELLPDSLGLLFQSFENDVMITDCRLYSLTLKGLIYNMDGSPGIVAPHIRRLNALLDKGGSCHE